MNKDFKKGNIVEFDNKIGTIVVLGNLMYNDNYYILACPIKGEKNNIKANLFYFLWKKKMKYMLKIIIILSKKLSHRY